MSTSVVKGRLVAVYDKNNSGAGDNPEDKLNSMVEAGENVSPADDAAAKAAQRRTAARERLEAKIAEDNEAERKHRRNVALIITSIVVIIAVIVTIVLVVNKKKDDKAREDAIEAAKWSSCHWVHSSETPDLLKQLTDAKKQTEEQWEQQKLQIPQAQLGEAEKQYNERMASIDAQIAYAPTAMELLKNQTRTVDAPLNGTYPRTGKAITILKTSAGDIRINLIHRHAACNDAAFEKLIEAKYFNNTSCHRMFNSEQGSVLQCGDPTGTGMGDPGFYTPDELPEYLINAAGAEYGMQAQQITYPKGTVAVANSGPNTGSGQFFIALTDTQLAPSYTVIGVVDPADFSILDKVKGYGIVLAPGTAALSDGKITDGAPATPVDIKTWTLVKTVGVEQHKAK